MTRVSNFRFHAPSRGGVLSDPFPKYVCYSWATEDTQYRGAVTPGAPNRLHVNRLRAMLRFHVLLQTGLGAQSLLWRDTPPASGPSRCALPRLANGAHVLCVHVSDPCVHEGIGWLH